MPTEPIQVEQIEQSLMFQHAAERKSEKAWSIVTLRQGEDHSNTFHWLSGFLGGARVMKQRKPFSTSNLLLLGEEAVCDSLVPPGVSHPQTLGSSFTASNIQLGGGAGCWAQSMWVYTNKLTLLLVIGVCVITYSDNNNVFCSMENNFTSWKTHLFSCQNLCSTDLFSPYVVLPW